MSDRGRERGQATVEFALTLPVFLLLVLVVVQIGLLARDRLLLAHVAREAARVAAVEPDAGAAIAAAHEASGLDSDRLDLRIGPERTAGERLTVVVTYRAPTDVPLAGALVGDVSFQSEVTVRIE